MVLHAQRKEHLSRAVLADDALTVGDRETESGQEEDRQHDDAGHDGCRARRTESLVCLACVEVEKEGEIVCGWLQPRA